MTYFRKGDIVSANGVVLYDFNGEGGHVTVVFGGRAHAPDYLKPSLLKLVTPLFKVGDLVRGNGGATDVSATIIAINGDHVWAKEAFVMSTDTPRQFIWLASEVKRSSTFKPEETAAEEPPVAPPVAEPEVI